MQYALYSERARGLSRRAMLQATGLGFGALVLRALLQADGWAAAVTPPRPIGADGHPRPRHFKAQARSVILLKQNGGPSQMELFDPKPELSRSEGKVHGEQVEMFQKGSEANKLL